MKNTRRGNALLIGVVALWLLATGLYLVLHSSLYQKKQQAYQMVEAEQELRRINLKDIENRMLKVEKLAGFSYTGGEEEGVNIQRLTGRLNQIVKSGIEDYGLKGLPSQEIDESKLAATEYAVTIGKVLEVFERRILELQEKERTWNRAISQLEWEQKNNKEAHQQVIAKQQAILSKLEEEKQALQQKYDTLIAKAKDKTRTAKDEKLAAQEEKEQIAAEIKRQRINFGNTLSKKKEEIKKIQAAKYGKTSTEVTEERTFDPATAPSDGEIVYSDPNSKDVYINLGSQNGVSLGLKFDVYRLAKKGERTYQGRIEVRRVKENSSLAMVLESPGDMDPIVAGDVLVNPVFSEETPVYFTFAGQFTSLSLQQVADFIQEIKGGKVEKTVSAKTNFVVVADTKEAKQHQNYLQAIKFKIPVITESQLLRYIGH